jgi:ClpP class serine protease
MEIIVIEHLTYNEIWAIEPSALEAISISDSAPRRGKGVEGSVSFSSINDATGILKIIGPLVPRGNFYSEFFGLTPLDKLTSDFLNLVNDPTVERIVLEIDSPGGAITGIAEFAALVASSDKEVTAYISGTGASAAYWIASAADEIVTSPTAIIGSIGVVVDVRIQKRGDVITLTNTQSPDKRLDIFSDKGQQKITKMLDDLAAVFISAVAEYRGTTDENVIEKYGRGGVLVAAKALKIGMIDDINTLQNTLAGLAMQKQNDTKVSIEEDERMTTLNEFLSAEPGAAKEFKKVIDEEMSMLEASFKQRIEAATKVLESSVYGFEIKALAISVLRGDVDTAALIGAQTVFDAMAAKEEIADARGDSEEQPETPAAVVSERKEDGKLYTPADIDAEIAEIKGGK